MIGGKVIETIISKDRVWINCQEFRNNKLIGTPCAIFVELSPKAKSVSEGDIVWWQGNRAMWTAKNSAGETVGKPDTVLIRIGSSGVSRPE
mgnify:CR=1 FL=1